MNETAASPMIVLNLDKPRGVVFNLGAMCELEKLLGKSIFEVFNFERLALSDIRLIIFAGLLGAEIDADVPVAERITLEQVDKIVRFESLLDNFEELKEAAQQILARAMPVLNEEQRAKVEEQKKRVTKLIAESTSSSSSPSRS